MKVVFNAGNNQYALEIQARGEAYVLVENGKEYVLKLLRAENGELAFQFNGENVLAHVAGDGRLCYVHFQGGTFTLKTGPIEQAAGRAGSSATQSTTGEQTVRSPMPGQVRALNAAEGDQVEKGQTLLLLEAMKMEIRVHAPRSGRLAHLAVKAGESVERDQVLAEIT